MRFDEATPVKDEVSSYLGEPQASESTKPLEWWRSRAAKYPALAQLARSYLAIPAISASVERIFSGGADLVLQKKGVSLLRDNS